MKSFSLMALVLALGLGLAVGDADAKRLGGGKSSGMQRQATTERAPTSTPAQTPATPSSAAAPATAAAPAAAAAGAAAAQPRRSWMGPLAGIAAGLGIAALASHFGFGEELASMLMIGLLVMAVLMVVGFVMRKRAGGAAAPALAGAAAGAGAGSDSAQRFDAPMQKSALDVPPSQPAGGASMIGANLSPAPASAIPADFDVAGFVRNAKVQFIRLQAANDAGNLDDIREFTTPEMFAEIKMDLDERAGAAQRTEVMQLDAQVIEVAEEALRYVVSVRFTGTVREDGVKTESLDEMWHLTKPRQGQGGWVLAGIQQLP